MTSAGNPIELDLSNKYVVKGINKEQVIDSVVRIHVGQDGRIEKLEDKWNGKLPEGVVLEVSDEEEKQTRLSALRAVRWGANKGVRLIWWAFCAGAWWWPFVVRRRRSCTTLLEGSLKL